MKDYHFEPDNNDFDQTIRLDDINEELKKIEQDPSEDELGDKDAFLNAFESEKFDAPLGQEALPMEEEMAGRQPSLSPHGGNGKPPFLNKKTVAIVAVAAVLLAILGFLAARGLFPDGKAPLGSGTSPMLVQGLLDGGEVIVYDIAQEANKSIVLTAETVITDAEGKILTNSKVSLGDLVMVGLDKTGKTALTIDFGGNIHVKEETGLAADVSKRVLVGELSSYSYGEQALFFYNGEEISPKELDPTDTLLLQGYADEVWSVEVLEFHGYIKIENKDDIQNGKFKLDEEEEIPLEEVERIAVKEGTHIVTVSGDNIEKRTDSIFVGTGEEYVYDLSKAQEKVGVVIINANVSDYKLYINGTLVDSSVPAVLPLGEYDLVILKNGYAEWSQHISLKSDTLTVDATLQRELQYGTLNVTADVDNATVTIDGKAMGTAPLEVSLPYGSYELEVTKNGYTPYSASIMVSSSMMYVKAELD